MKITGIIAEYNPFHNGHQYHLEETRRITNADYVIAVVSGNFMQRGIPSIVDKYLRTEAALLNGVDLVLELPLFYATGSAEYFATGAVALLDKLGSVDALCFGSECNDISQLSVLASVLAEEPENYRILLQKELKNGHSFPKARSLALESFLSDSSYDKMLVSSPNNILGIEYIKTLLKRNSAIIPCTIKRQGSGYHDNSLNIPKSSKEAQPSASNDGFLSQPLLCEHPIINKPLSSASAIRSTLKTSDNLSVIRPHMPAVVYHLLENAQYRKFPIYSDDFSSLLRYKLWMEASNGFHNYFDVSTDLSDKICQNLSHFTGYEQFCGLLKSKDLTYSRISRSLLHILLDMTQDQMDKFIQNDYISYARILGFRKTAAPLLRKLKTHTAIPLLSKLADARYQLPLTGVAMLEKDVQAAHIYDSIVTAKYRTPFINEYTRQLIILDKF